MDDAPDAAVLGVVLERVVEDGRVIDVALERLDLHVRLVLLRRAGRQGLARKLGHALAGLRLRIVEAAAMSVSLQRCYGLVDGRDAVLAGEQAAEHDVRA